MFILRGLMRNCSRLYRVVWLLTLLALVAISSGRSSAQTQPLADPLLVYKRDDVLNLMKRVLAFQVKAYGDKAPIGWEAGAFWAGVGGAMVATGDPAFHDAAMKFGEQAQWKVDVARRPFHSDQVAVGQIYLDLFLKDGDAKTIEHLKPALEAYLGKKTINKGDVGTAQGLPEGAPFSGRNVWWWCDALFMGPANFSRMYAATGDQRWLDQLHAFYWDSVDFLYDPAEGLFFRDAHYFADKKKSPTGKKIFWSRGNGWVYAGIIRTIDYVPEKDPQRTKYVDLFKQMTSAIIKYQGADGLWRPGLNEPAWFPMPETSGSGFFCFGLLAGINRGILDRETYLPIALRAWAGLTSHVGADGMLGYAQKQGAAPGETDAGTFRDYAHGAFLLAGGELYKMNLTAGDITKLKKPE